MEKDEARKWTDNQLKKMEKKVSDIYRKSARDINRKWAKYMDKSSKEVNKYQKIYDDAVKLGDAEKIAIAKKNLQQTITDQTLMSGYYKEMVEEVTDQLAKVNQTAVAYLNGEMPSVYTHNFNFKDGETEVLIDTSGMAFNLVDEATVKRRIAEGTIQLPPKKVDVPKDKQWNRKQLNSSVLQGIIEGESMDDIAKRILPIVNNNQVSAIRNARTMVTQAENQGRYDRYKDLQKRGAVITKVWMATGDKRTRDWHLTMDGQEQAIDEPFIDGKGNQIMMPGDPRAAAETVYNCRCTMRSHIIGFKTPDGRINYIDYDASKDEPSLHQQEITRERTTRGSSIETVISTESTSDKQSSLSESELKEKMIKMYSKSNVTDEEYKALYGFYDEDTDELIYAGYIMTDSSVDINNKIRTGKKLSSFEKATTDVLDNVIARSPLNESIQVIREVDLSYMKKVFNIDSFDDIAYDGLDINPDTIITDKAYMSTTLKGIENKWRMNRHYGDKVFLDLEVPSGTHAFVTDNTLEGEVILGRNTQYKLFGWYTDDDGNLILEGIVI